MDSFVEQSDSDGKLNQVFKAVDIYKSNDEAVYIKKTELATWHWNNQDGFK